MAVVLVGWCGMVLPPLSAGASGRRQRWPQLIRNPNGDGYVVPGTGLWLGADATMKLAVPEMGPAALEMEDVDLLIRYEPVPRLALFAETRLENTVSLQNGAGFSTGSGDLTIERLYADWALTPQLTARVGKFLTPFGIWNVIRRAPLTGTVERPLVTETFPEHVTGLSLIYQMTWHGLSLDATVYGPAQDELPLRRSEESGSQLFGGSRVAAGHELGPAYATLGLSGAGFENHDTRQWAGIYGADLDIALWGQQLTGEFAYSNLNAPDVADEWGCYLQDIVPIRGKLYAVARLEHFAPRVGRSVNGQLLGIFWRPLSHLIIKADYQFTDRVSDDLPRGLIASVSILF